MLCGAQQGQHRVGMDWTWGVCPVYVLSPVPQDIPIKQLQVNSTQRSPVCHPSIAQNVPQRRSLSLALVEVPTPMILNSTHCKDYGWCFPPAPAFPLVGRGRCVLRVCALSPPWPPHPRPLTALGHHALLCLGRLSLAHGAVCGAHLDHAVALLHAHPAGGAALVPLAPLGHQAAAGS